MSNKQWQIVVLSQCPGYWREHQLDLDEFSRAAGIHPATVIRLLEMGLIDFSGPITDPRFERREVRRLRRMLRLRRDLGINWAGLGLVIDLLETVERLEDEISRLKG